MTDNSHLSTISGRVDVTALLRDGRRQTVRTYLPPDYETSGRDYPVLYMFDGHNLFDRRTSRYDKEWGVDETLEAAHAEDPGATAVVVGIDAPWGARDRYAEYTISTWTAHPEPDDDAAEHDRLVVGAGAATAEFLMDVVKPWAEGTYRVATDRERVAVSGSSLGGYMSLYTATRYPERIGAALGFSPVVLDYPMAGHEVRSLLAASDASWPQRFYLDMGDVEDLSYATREALVANLGPLEESLRSAGHSEIWARVIAGGTHDEDSWRARFGEVLAWWLAGTPRSTT